MPRLFLGAILLILFLLLVNWAAKADRAVVGRVARYFGAFLVLVAAIFLITRGLADIAGVLVLVAAALAWRRVLPFIGGLIGAPKQPRSQVDSQYLRVTLDPKTGGMDGLILAGRFAGRHLSELSRDELSALYDELSQSDPEGAHLLDAYLSQTFPGDWQEVPDARRSSGGPLSRDEAFEVLGLKPGATVADIKAAHHQLMKKFHPDQGGSTYFASRINEAKDLLLKS